MEKKKLAEIIFESIKGAENICSGYYDIMPLIAKNINKNKDIADSQLEKAIIEKRRAKEYLDTLHEFYGTENKYLLNEIKDYLIYINSYDGSNIISNATLESTRKKVNFGIAAAACSVALAYITPFSLIPAGIFTLYAIGGEIGLYKLKKAKKQFEEILNETKETSKELNNIEISLLEEVLLENKQAIREMIK